MSVATKQTDVFAGLTGPPLDVARFDLGCGVVAEQTFAHLMAPFMLAFKKPEPGQHHPGPWRAANGGLGFDIVIQISNPGSLATESPLGQQGSLIWIVALFRIRVGPRILVPAVSNLPFAEGPTREGEVQYWPYEIEARALDLSAETSTSVSELDLAWIRKFWMSSAQLAAKHAEFKLLVEALDQCIFAKRNSLAVLLLWSALEAMFSTGREELRYRMSTTIAAYLEPAGLGRMSLQKRVAKLYDGRSAAAHGRQDKASDALPDTFNLVRRIATRMIEENAVPTRAGLEARLFGADPA